MQGAQVKSFSYLTSEHQALTTPLHCLHFGICFPNKCKNSQITSILSPRYELQKPLAALSCPSIFYLSLLLAPGCRKPDPYSSPVQSKPLLLMLTFTKSSFPAKHLICQDI